MAYSYGLNTPGAEINPSNSGDPRWRDECRACGYARINQRHGPPPRTRAFWPPEECRFVEAAASRTEKQGGQ